MNKLYQLISYFNLQPHPEGGWFTETFRSGEIIESSYLPERFGGQRCFSTAIYFLLEQGNFSAFHRIKSDECWHFYQGGALEIFLINKNGGLDIIKLGNDFEKGELFQYVVPAGCWFASRPAPSTNYSFVGCTVAPGFDFADFEMAHADSLIQQNSGIDSQLLRSLCR